jgi:hypothetical protein
MGVDARLATEGPVRRPEASLQVFQYGEAPDGSAPFMQSINGVYAADMPRYVAAVETL